MPAPPSLIHASLSLCETLLEDKDNIFSLIRMVDVFWVLMPEEERAKLAPQGSKFFVQITMLAHAKFDLADTSKHVAKIAMIRPGGETKESSEPLEVDLALLPGPEQGIHEALWRVLNVRVTMNVQAKELGRHWFTLLIDGEEVARTPFALLEHSLSAEA